jgi:hypothetical protein
MTYESGQILRWGWRLYKKMKNKEDCEKRKLKEKMRRIGR